MSAAARGRRSEPDVDRAARRPHRPAAHLGDEIVKELRATARPGKAEILVQAFSEATGAFLAGDFEAAIRLGEQSKHLALRAASIREMLGLAYYRAARWNEAARELSAFRRLSGRADQNPVLGDCYRALGKPERAIELCDEIPLKGTPPEIYFEGAIVGAMAQAETDHLDAAIARLEALPLQPEVAEEHHLRAWYVLGDLLERRGRYTQALEWFEATAGADADLTDAPERAARIKAHLS